MANGITRIKDSTGAWKPLRGLWTTTAANVWTPVQKAWVKNPDGDWEQIYPIPAGINTATPNIANLSVYQHWHSDPQTITITNTGNYPLTISNVMPHDGADTITTVDLTGINGGVPYTMQPNNTAYIKYNVYGNTVGTSTGNITFTQDVGFFGSDGNTAYWPGNKTVVPIVTTVLPDYAGITTTPNPYSYLMYQYIPVTNKFTITNSGNGADLVISSITVTGNGTVSAPTASTVGFNFNTYTGNTTQFTFTSANLSPGIYNDTITVNTNIGAYTIPVTANVIVVHGDQVYNTTGTYNWVVPPGVLTAKVAVVGGGGGGGGASWTSAFGAAGGGGGCSTPIIQTLSVTPGDTYVVTIGAGGAGAPGGIASQYGQDNRVWGSTGGTTTITGPGGTVISADAGGTGGVSGMIDVDGDNDYDGPNQSTGGNPGPGGLQGGAGWGSQSGGKGGSNGLIFRAGTPAGLPNDYIGTSPSLPTDTADRTVYAVSYPVYPGFLNSYGVWTSSDAVSPVGSWVAVNYTTILSDTATSLYCCADNHIRVTINGTTVGYNDSWPSVSTFSVNYPAGPLNINVQGLNDGGPASFAAVLYNSSGAVLWSTRSPLSAQAIPDPKAIYGVGGSGADATTYKGGNGTAGNAGGPGAVILIW